MCVLFQITICNNQLLQSSQPLGAVSLLHYTTRHSMTVLTVFCLAKVARSDTGWRQNLWNRWSCGTRSSKLAVQVRAVLSQRWSVDCVVVYAYRSCIASAPQQNVWLEMCAQNILLPRALMVSPDCVDHLMKNRGEQGMAASTLPFQRRLLLLLLRHHIFYVSSVLG